MRPGGSSRRWRRLRAVVAAQLAYSGEAPCPRCGEPIRAGDKWDLDHLVPITLGGLDTLDNLAASHPKCNRSAGARPAAVTASRRW